MKYCQHCGKQLEDDALFCIECGAKVGSIEQPTKVDEPVRKSQPTVIKENKMNPLQVIAFAFMIITAVASISAFCIPLLWIIPMTVSYNNKIKNGEEVGIGFKICVLLFVNIISGILMLCDNN